MTFRLCVQPRFHPFNFGQSNLTGPGDLRSKQVSTLPSLFEVRLTECFWSSGAPARPKPLG